MVVIALKRYLTMVHSQKEIGSGARLTRYLAEPCSSCVIFGTLINFSGPQFFHLKTDMVIVSPSRAF